MLHYLLIPREEKEQTLESVTILPLDVQIELAEYDINAEELAEYFQIYLGQKTLKMEEPKTEQEYLEVASNKKKFAYAHEVVRSITSTDYYIIPYDNSIYEVSMNEDENSCLACNNELLINVKRNDVGYSVDVYDQHMQNEDGLFGSITVWDDDLS